MKSILKTSIINDFQCLGPECPDTCCKQFTVAVDPPTFHKYQTEAPELLDFIGDKPGIGKVLKFDEKTGFCPKLVNGGCNIHANYGTDFLTDTCHLYPRITRALGEQVIMSGSLSCPEVVRLALKDNATAMVEAMHDRLPLNMVNYLPKEWNEDAAIGLHRRFISLAEQSFSTNIYLSKLAYFSTRFGNTPPTEWGLALDASWQVMDVVLPKAKKDQYDNFYLLILFSTIIAALKYKINPRLQQVMDSLDMALSCSIEADSASVNTTPESLSRAEALSQKWDEKYREKMEPTLKKILLAKLNANLFPYAGLGVNVEQKVWWLGIQMAFITLAFKASCYQRADVPGETEIIQIVQSLTRVLDHLTSLDLALPMMKEAGWMEIDRFIGLVA